MRHREQTGTENGPSIRGIDFASQDCLGLSTHPEVVEAAADTLRRYGVRSVCSVAEAGDAGLSVTLERRIAAFLQMEAALLLPTGRAAGLAVMRGLVRPGDHVVMDAAVQGGLRDGAQAATPNLSTFRHLDAEHARVRVRAIRASDPRGGILVVTESLSPLDSGTPDLAALRAFCDAYGATLLVDVSQDLGCLGEDGRGHLGLQDMLGKADLVTGSFSKSFASNGGFVASGTRSVTACLRAREGDANALSPIQAAVILQAFAIVDAAEGRERRARLMRNVLNLRTALRERALDVCGEPSATVSVRIGSSDLACLVGRRLSERGLLVDVATAPEAEATRLRLHVTAGHSEAEIARAAASIAEALDHARSDAEARTFRAAA